jgi:hypothetical protein
MIDLSITKNPDWIKQREEAWKKVYAYKKEDTRKSKLAVIKRYFMTGETTDGDPFEGNLNWFPLQNPEGWDYYFQFGTSEAQQYEREFYDQFNDLSHHGLSPEEELAMWDYFAGDTFKPVVTSRVPVGREAKVVSFTVKLDTLTSHIGCYLYQWIVGEYGTHPKISKRINYFLTSLQFFSNTAFIEKREDGYPRADEAIQILMIFETVCDPDYGSEFPLNEEGLQVRKEFIARLRTSLDSTSMPPAMKLLWEEKKAEYGV